MTDQFPLPTHHPHQWVAFLTARCNFACDYCIQKPAMLPGQRRKPWGRYQELTGEQWVRALNSFPERPSEPLILTGGEPSLHKDFVYIATELDGYDLDMTSNLTFDIDAVAAAMRARGKRFKTSFHTYHPKFLSPEKWLDQAERLRDSGLVDKPTFSMVQLGEFPHFRDDEHDRNIFQLVQLANRRGLTVQFNEFRGVHLGTPYDRQRREAIECTSAWVNIDPEGNIHNCMFHLTERRHAFGNVTDIARCRPLPHMGQFFGCGDFGFCDPCHENSGHGAFRSKDGEIFGRNKSDPRIYLRTMDAEAMRAVARRYIGQANFAEAEFALQAAIARSRNGGKEDQEAWADLGVVLYAQGHKNKALAALLHAVELGATDRATLADTMACAIEVGRRDEARAAMLARVPAQILDGVEQDAAAAIAQAAAGPTR